MKQILFILFAIATFYAQAQTKTESNYTPAAFWLTPRIEFELKDSSALFLETNLRYTDFNNKPLNYRSYAELGYEHVLNSSLHFGTSIKGIRLTGKNEIYFKLYAFHQSKLFKQNFRKGLYLEYLNELPDDNMYSVEQNYIRWSVEFGLSKTFTKHIGYDLTFRPFQQLSFRESSHFDDRWFDLMRLSLEMYYLVGKNHRLAVLFMKESVYYWVSAATPNYNLNQHRLVLGINYTYRFKNNDNN